ncbi:MAG: SCO family protein [Caldilineaceae bacterium]|nr:SCO family protein [Caldilineaceae bacterium]
MKRVRLLRKVAIVAILLSLALLGYRWYRLPPTLHGTFIQEDWPTKDFTLSAAGDQQVSLSDFRGKLVLLYFGYTYCPDICPTTLADAGVALRNLGAQADEIQVLMVSVDPARDSPEVLADYVQHFGPRFLGVTGTVDEVTAAASSYGVTFFKEEENSATDYLVAHSTQLFVIDRQGHVRHIFPFGVSGEDMAIDLRYLLSL